MSKTAHKNHILIAGLGDIGTGLATALQQEGHRISAIRRNTSAPDDIDLYPQDLVTTPAILLPPDPVELLIIILSPNRYDETGYRDSFLVAPMRLLDALSQQQPLPAVIFVSSTAVFGDIEGVVDENTTPAPSRFNGRILLAAEEEISARTLATSVRFAGIHGRSERRREEALAIANGEKPLPPARWLNRIHRNDCITLLQNLAHTWLEDGFAPPLVVGCDNPPISNHSLYAQLAKTAGIPLAIPEDVAPTGKYVRSCLSIGNL